MPVDPARAALVSQQYRQTAWLDPALGAARPTGQTVTVTTLLAEQANAEALATAHGAFLGGATKRLWTFRAPRYLHRIEPGMTIRVEDPAAFAPATYRDLFVTKTAPVAQERQRYIEVTGWG